MLIGLDVSSSITGYTIIEDGNIILNNVWDLRKYNDFFEKAKVIEEGIKEIERVYGGKIRAVYIEQSLQSFKSGFSSAKTLSTLSRFNGVVSWFVYDIFNIKPEYIDAKSARKLCGIIVPKNTKAKEVVLKYLLENETNFIIEYTKHGNPKPECYDKADSIIIAKAGFIKQNK